MKLALSSGSPLLPKYTMTLDVLHFIDNKGGNAQEIRESQRKRGLSVEIVDEVIQMYQDWVKSAYGSTIWETLHTDLILRQWTLMPTTSAKRSMRYRKK